MSKGLGRIERAILDLLDGVEAAHDTYTIAATAFTKAPDEAGRILVTDAELAGTRRALGKLKRIGRAFDLGRAFPDGRRRWAGERFGLRHTIRRMQHENLADPAMLTREGAKLKVAEMMPLLKRARELGVNLA